MTGTLIYSLTLVLNLLCSGCAPQFNPRTPQQIAKQLSGFDLPIDVRVLAFRDGFVGKDTVVQDQGFLEVIIQPDAATMAMYLRDGDTKGYKPITESDSNFKFIYRELSESVPNGMYLLNRGKRTNYWLVVLNSDDNTMRVRYSHSSMGW